MRFDYRFEVKTWLVYFAIVVISVFVHELGHCYPAWINGYWAVPTPAKEYMDEKIPDLLIQYISLGGIIGTVLVSAGIIILYSFSTFQFNSSILAGAIVTPGIYSLRYILIGRGHDATEFQEAQAALGLDYSGHSLDWFFIMLFLAGVVIWIIKSKPDFKVLPRLLIGSVSTVIFIAGLQVINNAVFDPVFQK